MPEMIATNVIVELEVAIVVTEVPIAGGLHTMDQTAVMQNRQFEAGSVPTDETRGVTLNRFEKTIQQHGCRIVVRSKGTHPEPDAGGENAGARRYLEQRQRTKVGYLVLAPAPP